MRFIDLTGKTGDKQRLLNSVPRAALGATEAQEQVTALINAVRLEGEKALREQAERFDGVAGHALRVPESEITAALDSLDPALRDALKTMVERVHAASLAQIPAAQTVNFGTGAEVSLRWQPVSRVGLYVPGGKAVYPSSVIMNAVPAKAAKVESLVICSPVQPENGSVHPTILAAAALCGVDEVYAIGGAGAIAAMAYGVPDIGLESVDVITGPGNIFVAAAKRAVNGVVGIDSEAGTTEIMVLADSTSEARFVAADLLSQAEHDEAAASVLVTDSQEFAAACAAELQQQLAITEHRERATRALEGPQSGVILVRDRQEMIAVADAYAAEHLSIQTADAEALASEISNAGAIFIGPYAPVSLGDYMAGSNHVLPTGGTARFNSGLGAHTFLRPQQVINYSKAGLQHVLDPLLTMSDAEGLPAHGAAAAVRFGGTS
ncbi:histidinol dehydrogenase [Canibacter zhoujuaniae]|uniref:histidinol dehydrogenase n=1 Tax=Canibacter zhoujuaniae TaxID=2708343 RepID=UPI001420A7A2|nr:histidinol dehydrogenase [Canibacter zhoujuaniae]